MEQMLQIRCKNNKKTINICIGSTLSDVYDKINLNMKFGPVAAKVNNKVEGLCYRLYHNKDVEFIDLHYSSGSRIYSRSLFFVLCKAVSDIYPEAKVVIDIPVSNGYYCDLQFGRAVTMDDADRIRRRMQEIIDADIPIQRHEVTTEEAIRVFGERGEESKVKLLHSIGALYTVYYDIDGYCDYYYGTLLPRTSGLHLFGLEKYYDGLLLRIPSQDNPSVLGDLVRQDKMFEIFKEHHLWQELLGLRTIGDLNEAVAKGHTTELINLSEALQEKKISRIADDIASRKGVKMVLIAGPSSSGKTTACKRLSIQLLTNGIRPIPISLDDYFVDRDKTPRDETGDYDFESLYSLDIPLLNRQMNALFAGEEVELPKYNFQTGKSERSGRKLRLKGNEVLVVEGIHALNPELTAQIPEEHKFKVYASALTTILLDTHNYVPTTDNRLLRRIIRDYKYRGVSARETIRRWPSVRAGENKWIFPYQENADVMFNTAMLFELAVIKTQAEPLLELVPENAPEYSEAYRLLKFLRYIKPIPYRSVPPTSLLREFLGGSSFKY
ncbi:nucleoside kinase [Xylanibacter muris]|uniref:Nucleoside kinase n=1 Tax=Xylanibacter muris TaxID=2736290 RepID=A0ABX2AJ28_9BACT|nr:nucleoside kinase [Xylanibacter muris]NPD91114.1 nucleoside kinase [Xylanibacter muris]